MSFIPHTEQDVQAMLEAIGARSVDELFAEIPAHLQIAEAEGIPDALNEQQIGRWMRQCAQQDEVALNFIGAGAYEHYIPAAVWEVASRGEWMTAYTPYQAEASQGTLQLLYEFQTMMTRLMQMDVSNASMYDGASALAESVLMAARCLSKIAHPTIAMPQSVHPLYRQVVQTLTQALAIHVVEVPYCPKEGRLRLSDLKQWKEPIHALVIPQPNFFGVLEEVDELVQWAHSQGIFTIAQVNPLLMGALTPPGEWGAVGVDLACGEGQPLGIPLSSGGPYFGFLCCRERWIRQLPGRLIGRTLDKDGKEGFVLTLQAREQHIRRAKATSNICTNQGLLVTAATLYMSLMSGAGLREVASASYRHTHALVAQALRIPGVSPRFTGPYFHECALQFETDVPTLMKAMRAQGIEPGYDLGQMDANLKNCLLVCATETKTNADLETWAKQLKAVL